METQAAWYSKFILLDKAQVYFAFFDRFCANKAKEQLWFSYHTKQAFHSFNPWKTGWLPGK